MNEANPHFLSYPQDGIDIKQIAGHLYRHIWIIFSVACCTLIIAFFYTFTIEPQYQTTALIQVKSSTSKTSFLGKLAPTAGDSELDIQTALLRTRFILEPVILQNNLNITVTPHYFPIFGHWLARHAEATLAQPLLGLKTYAWGGEELKIQHLSVPNAQSQQKFKLIAEKNNTYQLYSEQGQLLLKGQVGTPSSSSNYPGLLLELTTLKARPGTEFFINYISPLSRVKSLAHQLQITNIFGNDPTQSTGLLQLQLTGSDPDQISQTLQAIIHYMTVKNSAEKTQEAQKTLDFLTQKLSQLKISLNKAENDVNQYHMHTNTLSMAMVSRLLLSQLNTIEGEVRKTQTAKEELLQAYTEEHPLVIAATQKEIALNKQLTAVKKQIGKFPLANQQELDLTREAKTKNQMYISLLASQQQLQVAKAGLVSDVRTLAEASPANSIPTHKVLTVIIGFLMGAFLSSIVIIIKSLLTNCIEDANQLETALQIPIQCILPYSRKQKSIEKMRQKTIQNVGNQLSLRPLILAKEDPDNITIESLRSLRIALQMMPTANPRLISIMGSLANIGKSFVSLNLSQVIADTGKRTLLIDADIRKGQLHHALSQPKSNGLGEYLEGKCQYQSIIRSIDPHLSFIACGSYTKHPLELFQNKYFLDLIAEVKQDFDQVIIDTPPILAVSDSVLIAKHSDVQLFVVSAGKDTLAEVKQAIKKARSYDVNINGIVFNHQKPLTPYGTNANSEYVYGDTKQHAKPLTA